MTTLLFGGAGFVGNNLARKLLNEGHSVAVFDDFSTGRMSNLEDMKDKIVIKRGDVRDMEAVKNFTDEIKPGAVYFLAALHFIPDCNRDPQKAFAVNVLGAKNVIHAAARLQDKPRFIHISTSSVYRPSDEPIKETHPTEPFEVYGKSKLEGEGAAREECEKNGMTYFILRPFSIYGPFAGIPQVIPEIVSQLKSGVNSIKLGNLFPERDFIYVTEVADVLALLLARGTPGAIYNVGANAVNSIQEVTDIIKDLLKNAGREVEFISEESRSRGDLERNRLVGDDNKIMQDLDWRPKVTLRGGLEMLLKAEGLI
ncbi:MAG: GDP-mannose 4,6-dehydratase [Candidatus Liptonbacteria bacterium]|nr:GDP-mannose 4,6-dehydratase [Candidatus Liptonbacteria bacterium]